MRYAQRRLRPRLRASRPAAAKDKMPAPCVWPFSYLRFSYLGFQGLGFEQKHLTIVVNTSRDRLLIQALSILSIEMSRILSRKTAVRLIQSQKGKWGVGLSGQLHAIEHADQQIADQPQTANKSKATIGWHYSSNDTCLILIRPHLFVAFSVVSRIIDICHVTLFATDCRKPALDK